MTRQQTNNPLIELAIIAVFLIAAGPILAPYVGVNLTLIGGLLLALVVVAAIVVIVEIINSAVNGF